ncbi:S-layer homology domain-containing protein [Candidatus Peribacteria bacterium]|nr:S-layer homology domain-containing protein [Candidatus Peribacteria bacterium]
MKASILSLIALLTLMSPRALAQDFHENTKDATVLIISYDIEGHIIGRGSGFYVDEGTIVTNIHVIDGYARYYRIFITGADGKFDSGCFKDITRSDIKLNLEDDIAYIRAYVDCPHTSVYFADSNAAIGSQISIYGYPALGDNFFSSFEMIKNDGEILSEWPAKVGLKEYRGPWYYTDALIHGGNSGGPVVQDGKVIGIAVASHQDASGAATDGIFIPVSIIVSGLMSANNSTFGYTPQNQQKNIAYVEPEPEFPYGEEGDPFNPLRTMTIATNRTCDAALGHGGEATGLGGCQCKPSYHQNSAKTACLPGAEGWTDPNMDLTNKIATTKANTKQAPLFSDYDESQLGYEAVRSLKEAGVISGYPDGTFQPRGTINRAELLKIIMEGFFPDEIYRETHCFSDIANEWFAPYVCAAKRLGWISGYSDGTFQPSNAINRAEGIKIIVSSLSSDTVQPDIATGNWFDGYVEAGMDLGILKSLENFFPGASLTREDAALWIVSASEYRFEPHQ